LRSDMLAYEDSLVPDSGKWEDHPTRLSI